ncbi:hypothetical protein EHV23_13345 [Lautropia dentalis]|uniref:Uncharacterized protein n=1 Tax=Lautropia dentalis TaxID=2490857 RepID=A0A3R8NAS9_9BURK|nr:hypothetical protein [Lautropia dentalis]RRN44303.1 hypothetical protein EHV23_13345 [Lautropia dentalis]
MSWSNNAGGNLNLSGTYGLGLEMDSWAYEARGRNRGIKIGREEGYASGYSSGKDEGLTDGIGIGSDIAWSKANAIIADIRTEANNYAICMNTFRRALDVLMRENKQARNYILRVIYANYVDEVTMNLERNIVSAAPHFHRNFSGIYWRTGQMINDALNAEMAYMKRKRK